MTTHARWFAFGLHPLIAEAKRRFHRRLLLLAALALIVAGSAAAVIATRAPSGANGNGASLGRAALRSCGQLGVGIGWNVSASSSLGCNSAMAFVRTYLHFPVFRRHRTVLGYSCTYTTEVRCTSGET